MSGAALSIWMPWKTNQRARLHLLSHQEPLLTPKIVLTNPSGKAYQSQLIVRDAKPPFLDVALLKPELTCPEGETDCDKMAETFKGYGKEIPEVKIGLFKYLLG